MSSAHTDHEIDSAGTAMAAYVYRPDGVGPHPCVVMAHGFTAVRDQRLPAYAERFQAAGYAVVLFDYRGFGASAGQPRQVLSIPDQHADFRAAIRFARAQPWVDGDRIVLWGSSFSGGHVVCVAAADPHIAAVIAQVPFADGRATLGSLPKTTSARIALRAVADKVGSLLGRPPVLVAAVGPPGSLAILTMAEAEPGFRSIDPPDSLWRNELAARLMLSVGTYRPISKAPQLAMPLLVTVAEHDQTVPPEPAARMGAAAPHGTVIRYPIGHFDIYLGEPFETTIADQLAWLLASVPVA